MADDTRLELDVEEMRDLIAYVLELPVAEVTDDASFVDELEVDSLTAMDMVINLEKRYGIKLSDTEFKEMGSFADVRELVASKLVAGS
ncbi:MAG: acyl carrier protein [Actinomycetota bacterium]|nr:acyl carrier protein [Actinomycetota bacterium]